MKSHVLRPLYVILALVGLILLSRVFIVPKDFGVQERGFMYGWHRKGNEQEWKDFKVKYKTVQYCSQCHTEEYSLLGKSPHIIIQCENCHGPAVDHPADPPKLSIDRSRGLCLRCHSWLPYEASGRYKIPGINPEEHNPGIECVACHNPHSPKIGS
jgi:predicted CXXCH cytochrome family protein